MDVDAFIDDRDTDPYASFVLTYMRGSSAMREKLKRFMGHRKLFCTYNGFRYRVTGVSVQTGSVLLSKDQYKSVGYEVITSPSNCTDWSEWWLEP